MMPAADAVPTWRELNARGVASCGLGARDTLRLEAGMNLYGSDMDESTHPLESNLGWTVAFEPPARDFVGHSALDRIRGRGPARKLVGLVLMERGVLRAHQTVIAAEFEPGDDHERDLLADAAALHRPGTSPERRAGGRAGRYPRQAARCAHRATTVRASRPIIDQIQEGIR